MVKQALRRCAVYTRKSSEEGLEQDFNSLQAQREACEAFIKSQVGEGWKLISTAYDDGGISGGTMERPALQSLLADIALGKVDVIVVYKVDRLTRSLADFAKMVEVFDKHGVSFVAVTQQFNTTTSMGRLTLNVLLSFAQFEREVTGERIRDKIAASKAKGMWMGGNVSLGYAVKDRKLVPVESEAEMLRGIFKRYLKVQNVTQLKRDLERDGVRSRITERPDGTKIGGCVLSRGLLHSMLTNPIYIGQIRHKGVCFPGQHEPIVDREMWDEVQTFLIEQGNKERGTRRKSDPTPLVGKLFDESGKRMTPVHTKNRGIRYRYYTSPPETEKKDSWRVPAQELERSICALTKKLLGNQAALAAAVQECEESIDIQDTWTAATVASAEIADRMDVGSALWPLIERVDLKSDGIQIQIGLRVKQNTLTLSQLTPLRMRRRGKELRIVIDGQPTAPAVCDPALVKAIGRAHRWWDELMSGRAESITDVARQEGLWAGYVGRLLPLAFLAPDIVEMILRGEQPVEVTAESLSYRPGPYASWSTQQRKLAF